MKSHFDWPRGLNREEAAEYIGLGATTFDKLVAAGTMPSSIKIGSRKVWDRVMLDAAFSAMRNEGDSENQFDEK